MTKQELFEYAEHLFYKAGYNCAQTVLLAMAKYFAIEDTNLEDVSAAFGGGLSGIRVSVCGAVSGGIMVVGLMEKDDRYSTGKQLIDYVEKKCRSINCEKILDIDFNNSVQVAKEKAEKKNTICTPLIQDMCNWLIDRYEI